MWVGLDNAIKTSATSGHKNYSEVLKKYGELENTFQIYKTKFDGYLGMLTEEDATTAA